VREAASSVEEQPLLERWPAPRVIHPSYGRTQGSLDPGSI